MKIFCAMFLTVVLLETSGGIGKAQAKSLVELSHNEQSSPFQLAQTPAETGCCGIPYWDANHKLAYIWHENENNIICASYARTAGLSAGEYVFCRNQSCVDVQKKENKCF